MMKIKTKKEMSLHELIQWGLGNGIKHKEFTGSRNGIVEFDFRGWVRTDLIEPDETFTIEVEEELTEDTKIPVLVEVANIDKSDNGLRIYYCRGISISEAMSSSIESKTFYMLNDDMTMTLIWKDGELIK